MGSSVSGSVASGIGYTPNDKSDAPVHMILMDSNL